MYRTYKDACEARIGPETARREIEAHGASWEEFVAEVGRKETYTGREVLDWLGY